MDQLGVAGFDVEADSLVKDMAFTFTALRSAMLKAHGVAHPFQEIADEVFVEAPDGSVSVDVARFKKQEVTDV
jgi:hypothetical protein